MGKVLFTHQIYQTFTACFSTPLLGLGPPQPLLHGFGPYPLKLYCLAVDLDTENPITLLCLPKDILPCFGP